MSHGDMFSFKSKRTNINAHKKHNYAPPISWVKQNPTLWILLCDPPPLHQISISTKRLAISPHAPSEGITPTSWNIGTGNSDTT